MTAPEGAAYLPGGLTPPFPQPDGVDAPFWQGLLDERLLVQRCPACRTWQFGAEWLCHHCHRFDPEWIDVAPHGHIYSWERVWHPAHACLQAAVPYLVVLVELQDAPGVRLLGNLLGDPLQPVRIGSVVKGLFERHGAAQAAYALLQWRPDVAAAIAP